MNWIKVEEGTPKVRQWVYAHGKNYLGEAFIDETGWWRFSTGWGCSLNQQFCYVEGITHWRELPTPPTN